MAALVSLTDAKAHLRVTHDGSDDVIFRQSEEASDTILRYLKRRAHNPLTIESSSVASPTVITTEDAHGFANGATVVIADHEDSEPYLNGAYTISNVTTYTFTIPVAVTAAGTGGRAYVAWTEATVPPAVRSAVLLMLTHLYDHRGEDMTADEQLWLAVERLLMRHRDPVLA
jgi:hypothetical protein